MLGCILKSNAGQKEGKQNDVLIDWVVQSLRVAYICRHVWQGILYVPLARLLLLSQTPVLMLLAVEGVYV